MRRLLLLPAAAMAATAAPASAVVLFGVDEQNNLVTIDSRTPGQTLSERLITGTSSTFLALDFRPATGELWGLGNDRRLYTIDTISASATARSGVLTQLSGTEFAFDFNPTIDRIRVVSNTQQNYVLNPITGEVQLVATPVAYAGDDASAGRTPIVTAVAYTPAAQTGDTADSQLFAIDNAGTNDRLATLANNTGVMRTVGETGVNFGPRDSFDIDDFGNAFAINGRSLYSVDLGSGQFTLLGETDRSLFGLSAPPVPEPATWAMMIAGFALVGSAVRRRRTVHVAA